MIRSVLAILLLAANVANATTLHHYYIDVKGQKHVGTYTRSFPNVLSCKMWLTRNYADPTLRADVPTLRKVAGSAQVVRACE